MDAAVGIGVGIDRDTGLEVYVYVNSGVPLPPRRTCCTLGSHPLTHPTSLPWSQPTRSGLGTTHRKNNAQAGQQSLTSEMLKQVIRFTQSPENLNLKTWKESSSDGRAGTERGEVEGAAMERTRGVGLRRRKPQRCK